jgi:hypothetical protein
MLGFGYCQMYEVYGLLFSGNIKNEAGLKSPAVGCPKPYPDVKTILATNVL